MNQRMTTVDTSMTVKRMNAFPPSSPALTPVLVQADDDIRTAVASKVRIRVFVSKALSS